MKKNRKISLHTLNLIKMHLAKKKKDDALMYSYLYNYIMYLELSLASGPQPFLRPSHRTINRCF